MTSIFEIVENFNSEQLSKLSVELDEQNFRQSLISKNESGQTVLHMACQLGYTKMISQLLEYLDQFSVIKDVIDSYDNNHYTPLILVIKSTDDGVPEAVEALLKANANPNTSDKEGNTALHYAASMGQEECCELLLASNKIKIDSQNHDGQTPLIVSIIEGQFNIINMLLNHKIDLEIQDKKGRSAIHYAAITKGNSPAYIRILADKCDLNKLDNEGNTPVLLAASTSLKTHYRAIETLITLKVNLLNRNKQNKLAQNYVEELDDESKKTDYYALLKTAFKKKGVILIDENTTEKREGHKREQMKQEEEEQKNVSQTAGAEKEGGCGSCGEEESSCCETNNDKQQEEKKKKKSGCCGGSGGCCGDKKEEGQSCGEKCGCGPSSCKVDKKENKNQENSINTQVNTKKKLDFQEKFIIGALVPLNILFFYLLFQVFFQSK